MKGFTLIELMVVSMGIMFVIGILGLITFLVLHFT